MKTGYTSSPQFATCKRRRVDVSFDGGDISSDAGGAILLREAERQLDLIGEVSRRLDDPRRRKSIQHSTKAMLMQRITGIALGYEDLNDHETLRDDIAIQTAAGKDERLASPSTLGRLERRSDRDWLWAVHEVLVSKFISSFKKPPRQLILDFDATDDEVHGRQEGRFFNGYYDHYCFLPLYVFCGSHLLTAYLRQSNIDGAKHAAAILKLLVDRLREAWPKVKIIFRADSGFCRHRIMNWCDRNGVGYIIGLARNPVLVRLAAPLLIRAEYQFNMTGEKVTLFGEIEYGAATWLYPRRVVVKAEHMEDGSNPRFVVTNLETPARKLYKKVYCARGDMENRIKEQQLGLFADRTSATRWWANQARLLLSSLAYTLVDYIRRVGLPGTELAKAQVWTLRTKLFKIGAAITRNTRRIRFHLASGCPVQDVFWLAAMKLAG